MQRTQDQDGFVRSCNEAVWFPRNLVSHNSYDYNLKAYVDRLDERESQLLCAEERGSLDILDYDDQLHGRMNPPSPRRAHQGKLLRDD